MLYLPPPMTPAAGSLKPLMFRKKTAKLEDPNLELVSMISLPQSQIQEASDGESHMIVQRVETASAVSASAASTTRIQLVGEADGSTTEVSESMADQISNEKPVKPAVITTQLEKTLSRYQLQESIPEDLNEDKQDFAQDDAPNLDDSHIAMTEERSEITVKAFYAEMLAGTP